MSKTLTKNNKKKYKKLINKKLLTFKITDKRNQKTLLNFLALRDILRKS